MTGPFARLLGVACLSMLAHNGAALHDHDHDESVKDDLDSRVVQASQSSSDDGDCGCYKPSNKAFDDENGCDGTLSAKGPISGRPDAKACKVTCGFMVMWAPTCVKVVESPTKIAPVAPQKTTDPVVKEPTGIAPPPQDGLVGKRVKVKDISPMEAKRGMEGTVLAKVDGTAYWKVKLDDDSVVNFPKEQLEILGEADAVKDFSKDCEDIKAMNFCNRKINFGDCVGLKLEMATDCCPKSCPSS